MKSVNKAILMIILIIGIPVLSLCQSLTPIGQSINLCPGQVYTYTASNGCDAYNWSCLGCKDSTDLNGAIKDTGTNPDGTVWAKVKWDNTTTGSIGNYCGTLDVTIKSIAQPSISPSTQLLCGNGSVTLQASVSSATNITGYVWDIRGTGVTPTGSVTTNVPQLKLNYANWTSGSVLSATVAVGSVSACGYKTAVSPLKDITDLGITFKAIPRTAWVQLSPGNINNLLVPYSFSPTVICSTGTMQIANQPAGTNLNWSSSNPSWLSIDPSTGVATRGNNFSGNVTVSATVSNACGSNTENTNVWIGPPNNFVTLDGTSPLWYANCNSGNIPFAVGPDPHILQTNPGNGGTTFTLNDPSHTIVASALSPTQYSFFTKRSDLVFSITLSTSNGCGTISQCISFSNAPPPPVCIPQITSTFINGTLAPYTDCTSGNIPFFKGGIFTLQSSINVDIPITFVLSDPGHVVTNNVVLSSTSYQFTVSSSINSNSSFTISLFAGNPCGSSSQCLYFSNSINNAAAIRKESLSVFPNPASSTLSVQVIDSLQGNTLDQHYELNLMNKFSRKVFSIHSNEKTLEIPVRDLPSDIYYLNVSFKDAVLQKQIVIRK